MYAFLIFSFNLIFSQSENVNIKKEHGIDELLNKHIHYNEVMKTISGFRIQIFSGTGNYSKSNAINERTIFLNRYSNAEAHIIFSSPYYIVRIGDFRTKLEAEAFRQRILTHYPDAYIVRDDIKIPVSNLSDN